MVPRLPVARILGILGDRGEGTRKLRRRRLLEGAAREPARKPGRPRKVEAAEPVVAEAPAPPPAPRLVRRAEAVVTAPAPETVALAPPAAATPPPPPSR
jgi:hypothetical protein